MNQGIHALSAEAYHADPCPTASLSSSVAGILLNQSPAHAWLAHPRLNPAYVREDADSRFDLGSVAHMMLLERRTDRIVIVEAADWRTKAAKEAREVAHLNGQFAILARHYVAVTEMVAVAIAFLNTTELAGILESGSAEQSVLWQERDLWYRCRPDLLSADRRIILDYKTTECAAPDAFSRQIGRMGYDLQSEFYRRGVFAVTEYEPAFILLAQEISPPYACSLTSLSNAYRAVGESRVLRSMKIWETCVRANEWPSYTNQICYVEPNPWQLADIEDEPKTEEDTE
jgi:PDDEXK-like domain of unknown function (DUF3799)